MRHELIIVTIVCALCTYPYTKRIRGFTNQPVMNWLEYELRLPGKHVILCYSYNRIIHDQHAIETLRLGIDAISVLNDYPVHDLHLVQCIIK